MTRYAIDPYQVWSSVLAVALIPQSVNESAWIRASAEDAASWSLSVALARLPISFECLYPVCD